MVNAVCVQVANDFRDISSCGILLENIPNYGSLFFVNAYFFVLYIIPVRDFAAAEQSFTAAFPQPAHYLLGQFGRVVFRNAFQTTKWT